MLQVLSLTLGSSTVENTTSLPCMGLIESASKLYIDFNCVKVNMINILQDTLVYKAKRFTLTNGFS